MLWKGLMSRFLKKNYKLAYVYELPEIIKKNYYEIKK